jgi:toxin FitB
MSGWLLDTNVVSETAKPSPDSRVLAFLDAVEGAQVSSVTVFELERGVELLPPGKRRRQLAEWLALTLGGPYPIVPFDLDIARAAARLEVHLRRAGRGIELRDLFIAATAAKRGLRLATRNVAHFKGLGLELVDPFSD